MQIRNHQTQVRQSYNIIDLGDMPGIEYKRPVTLKKALYDIVQEKKLNEGIVGEKPTIQRFIEDLSQSGKILNRKITKLLGYGSVAAVFETPDGKVIKLTDGNHFPMNRPQRSFDVPIMEKGHGGRRLLLGRKTYFYLEEKLYQHNLPDYFADTVREMIKSDGFSVCDLYSGDTFQTGMSRNGRVYLVDPECARYKTIFHAIFDKAKSQAIRLIKKRI